VRAVAIRAKRPTDTVDLMLRMAIPETESVNESETDEDGT
jgi:hypothetical protein